jgi:hypothetical protein
MTKMDTGSSLKKAAAMEPRRAPVSLGAPSARWTMYWSVHQYHRVTGGTHVREDLATILDTAG